MEYLCPFGYFQSWQLVSDAQFSQHQKALDERTMYVTQHSVKAFNLSRLEDPAFKRYLPGEPWTIRTLRECRSSDFAVIDLFYFIYGPLWISTQRSWGAPALEMRAPGRVEILTRAKSGLVIEISRRSSSCLTDAYRKHQVKDPILSLDVRIENRDIQGQICSHRNSI